MKNLKIKVNEHEFQFSSQDLDELQVFNAYTLYKNKIYKGEVHDLGNHQFETQTKGRIFQTEIYHELHDLIESMGLNKPKNTKLTSLKAPMPGLVLQILIEKGQSVKENEKLLILEAMKMENVLRIPQDAVIKNIKVKSGEAVEKGQVLIELE